MSYDEYDVAVDDLYDRMSEELSPDYKEQAIDEFIKERMQAYYLKHPHLKEASIVSYCHAKELLQISPRSG